MLELNAHTLLIDRVVGKELDKDDSRTVKKLKGELAGATLSLTSTLNANVELAHRVKELELEVEAAKGEASKSRNTIESKS